MSRAPTGTQAAVQRAAEAALAAQIASRNGGHPPLATHLKKGLFYRIGVHRLVFRWDGESRQWLRANRMTTGELNGYAIHNKKGAKQ
jgi:hypothetical protein